MNRRYFFATAAAAATTAHSLASPNDTVRVAVVGVRGQGRSHINQYGRMKNVEIAALVDIDESVLNQRLGEAEKLTGKKPAAIGDIRKVLEDKNIDAVSLATPNHHHTLMTIWALQAGKHVYCEKPASYNMFESKQIVAATRKYNKLVQHGSNSRSNPGLIEAIQKLKEGVIGDVYMTRGLCYKWRDTIGRKSVSAVPTGVNYDLWTGPAPKREFTENRFHYNWHWFWDYGNGDLGNQGIHEVDICRWGLGVTYPTKVHSMGGHYMFDDDQETPNTLVSTFEFNTNGKKQLMTFEVRHWMSNHEAYINQGLMPPKPPAAAPAEGAAAGGRRGRGGSDPNTIGNIFYGSKGYMAIEGYTAYQTWLGREQEPGPGRREGASNWQNFIDAVRTGKREDLNAEIEEGAVSSTLVHLANISYRLGRSVNFDAGSYSCPGDKEATAMFTRKEGYRKPFVVPEKV
jgi:predicted dehydrogenase